jgi:hypothetical protein
LHYGDDRLAMSIDDVRRTIDVTMHRLTNEAVRWGLSRERAQDIVSQLLDQAPAAIAAARDETEGVPDELVAVVTHQLARLLVPE